jgi:hypothetical protein
MTPPICHSERSEESLSLLSDCYNCKDTRPDLHLGTIQQEINSIGMAVENSHPDANSPIINP